MVVLLFVASCRGVNWINEIWSESKKNKIIQYDIWVCFFTFLIGLIVDPPWINYESKFIIILLRLSFALNYVQRASLSPSHKKKKMIYLFSTDINDITRVKYWRIISNILFKYFFIWVQFRNIYIIRSILICY